MSAAEDKMLGFGSKFHMNASPFSVHYDGNGPYHSICFALELSPVIYVPRVQIFYVTIQAMFVSRRAQGVYWGAGAVFCVRAFVYMRECALARLLWQCQCVTAGPPG